jgi:hypothetical protein
MSGPLHAKKDFIHGGDVLRILKKYCTTREMQELTFWAVKTARSIRVITQREQRRLAALHGKCRSSPFGLSKPLVPSG